MTQGVRQLPSVPELPLGRDSWAWRVNAEPTAFLGAGRALLLQVAHPGVAAGVEQHSSYASDPWGRLFRTSDIMFKLTFGTPEQVHRQMRVLAAKHRRVNGTTEQGEPYRANDPALLLWVWATLVDTALLSYELVHRPLRPSEVEQYYRESIATALACGVTSEVIPASYAEFVRYFDEVVAHDLRVDNAARAVAVATSSLPLAVPDAIASLGAAPLRSVTVATLPSAVREQFGFELTSAVWRRYRNTLIAARAIARSQPTVLRQLPTVRSLQRDRPLHVGLLQRSGARSTQRRLAAAGYGAADHQAGAQ